MGMNWMSGPWTAIYNNESVGNHASRVAPALKRRSHAYQISKVDGRKPGADNEDREGGKRGSGMRLPRLSTRVS